MATAANFAMIALGADPLRRYPDHDLRLLVVGKNEEHLSDPVFRALCLEGAFYIIKDEVSKLWRAVRPSARNPRVLDDYDLAYREKWRPAPPLIPESAIVGGFSKGIAWRDKKSGVPRKFTLRNGTAIEFFSSEARPRHGIKRHGAWFDEEMLNTAWYPETIARLTDYEGFLDWSATPQGATEEFLQLHEQAVSGRYPDIEEFTFLLEDNPYISQESRQDFLGSLLTDEDRATRYYGEYALHALKVYPMFRPFGEHGCATFPIPREWTLYLFVDPGYQVGAGLIVAVPPGAKRIHIIDEICIKQCTPRKFAAKAKEKLGRHPVEAFVMDSQMGRQSSMATGITIHDHYAEEFERLELASRSTGYTFLPASNDIKAREIALKRWMDPGGESAKLCVHYDRCPALVDEMCRQFYQKDRPDKRGNQTKDLVTCLEYAAAFDPYFVEDQGTFVEDSYAVDLYKAKQRRLAHRQRYAEVEV